MEPTAGRVLRFGVAFGVTCVLSMWVLDGTGPVALVNNLVLRITHVQALVAGALLRAVGEAVGVRGSTLYGHDLVCQVDTGCNGMSAIAITLAGLLNFPSRWTMRVVGILSVPVAVLMANCLRIAGLYLTGARHPQWFGIAHVYAGQILLCTVTISMWMVWLSWTHRAQES